jgi:hypothetical protein
LDTTSKDKLNESSLILGDSMNFGDKSLSKVEFHQILERYKAKAMAESKPNELSLIPERPLAVDSSI